MQKCIITSPFLTRIFVLLLLTTNLISAEGFIVGTLVKTPSGYREIEELKSGDLVVCYNFLDECVERPIIKLVKTHNTSCIAINVCGEVVYTAPDHKFYLPTTNSWIQAQNLDAGQVLLKHCTELITVDQVTLINQETEFYDITVADFHNFCVSMQDIHVHNFFPAVGLTISWAPGVGVAVTGGIGMLGAAIGGVFWGSSEEAKKDEIFRNMENTFRREEEWQRNWEEVVENKKPKNDGKKKPESPDKKPTRDKPQSKPNSQPETDKGVKGKVKNLPTNKGDFPFIPKKTKDGSIPRTRTGGFIDRNGRPWEWDPKKKEWDVQIDGGKRHKNVNTDGNITH